jgi:hypothetical protein
LQEFEMILGSYHKGQGELPRVIHISVARFRHELPQPYAALDFLVAIREEGGGALPVSRTSRLIW